MSWHGISEADANGFVGFAEGREPPGWKEVDPRERALTLAAVRRVITDALIQNVSREEIFTVLGESIGRYESALREGEKASHRAGRALGVDMTKAPKFRYNRRMSEGERLRYRFFLGLAK